MHLRAGAAAAALAISLVAGCTENPGSSASRPASTTGTPSQTTVPATTSTSPGTATSSPPATAPIDTDIKAYGDCRTPVVEPDEIILACADKGALIQGISWTSWASGQATGVGTLRYNDCTPNCAAGTIHYVPRTNVTLTVPVRDARGQVVYSLVQEDPEPPGYTTGPSHGGPQPLPTQPN